MIVDGKPTTFTFADAAYFRVDGHAHDAIAWFHESFHPWLRPAQSTAATSLILGDSPDAYRGYQSKRTSPREDLHCFTLDAGTIALPAWPGTNGVALHDADRSCFINVDDAGIQLCGDPGSKRWRFTAALVLYELLALALRPGSIDLHAAAVDVQGRGVLVAGPKMAGKTTLSIYLLRSGEYRAVANDRCFVQPGPDTWQIHGVPTPVKIRAAAVQYFPDLLNGFPRAERPYLYRHCELAALVPRPGFAGQQNIAMMPSQFVQQLDVQAVPSTSLALAVFPRVVTELSGFRIERLDEQQLRHELLMNLYGNPRPADPPSAFQRFGNAGEPDLERLITSLAGTIAGYRLLLGPDAYQSGKLAAELAELAASAKS